RRGIGGIESLREDFRTCRAQFALGPRQLDGSTRADTESSALCRERLRHRAAKSLARASDHHNFPFKPQVHESYSFDLSAPATHREDDENDESWSPDSSPGSRSSSSSF